MTNRTKLLALAAGILLGAASARSDTFTSTLSLVNFSGFTGPYGTVTVTTPTTNSTTATITFTAASGYVFIDSSLADVNVNASSFTGTPVSWVTHAGDTSPTIVNQGSANAVDGWGSFNLTFGTTSGFGSAVDSFTFTVTDTSGTWASAASVLIANALGFDAAAHIAPLSAGGSVTGFAAEPAGGTNPVPEPATLWLLGSGLSVLSGIGLRRRSNASA